MGRMRALTGAGSIALALLPATLAASGAAAVPPRLPASSTAVPAAISLPAVINGTAADRSQTKWFVSWYPGDGGHCGGTIIASRWILTAAHCIFAAGSSTQTWVQVNPKRPTYKRTGYRVDRMIAHPGFVPGEALPNDIGLLHVTSDLPKATVALNTAAAKPAKGSSARVYGFGATGPKESQSSSKILLVGKLVDLTGPKSGRCGKYRKSRFDPAIQLCAGGAKGAAGKPRVDACYGDSGGPLIATVSGSPKLVGIVSSGGDVCDGNPAAPGIYTRVSAFAGWVREAIAGPNLMAESKDCPPPDRFCQMGSGKPVEIKITNMGGQTGSWTITTKANALLRPSQTTGRLAAGESASVKVTATGSKKGCQVLLVSGAGMIDTRFTFLVNGDQQGC